MNVELTKKDIMKELSIEEKARAYDEAIKRAKSKIKNDKDHVLYEDDIIEIFPELYESEDDRIRKELTDYIKSKFENSCSPTPSKNILGNWIAWLEKQGDKPLFTYDDILALQCCMETSKKVQEDKELYEQLQSLHNRLHDAYWLEKQGEQKPLEDSLTLEEFENAFITKAKQYDIDLPNRSWDIYALCKELYSLKHKPKQGEQKSADKIESKFNLYDWVATDKGVVVQIGAVNNGYYTLSNGMDFDMSYVDKYWHKWTIEDAKDGDVLVCGDNPNDHHVEVIMIFKSLRNKLSAFTHFHIFYNEFRTDNWCNCGKNVHPATKEQRDILFQKMKKSGYEWDANKKELIKL